VRDNLRTIRVAAVGDLHCTKASAGMLQPLFGQIAQSADMLALCGDLTNRGLPEEAAVLVKELSASVKLPTIAVLGNHDYESGQVQRVEEILTNAGIVLLDGEAHELGGVGFAGTKGFLGGFGRGTLAAFGEGEVKSFVQIAIDESMKLETALARLRTVHKIALLHYAPIRGTVEGEPPEIFPYLGCSRLEEPLNRYQVTAVVHGHAHHGSPEGKTTAGVPVYNVSLPLMQQLYPDRPAFRLLNLTAAPEDAPRESMHRSEPVESRVDVDGRRGNGSS
jgi:Icc-related predicted phosphoesterase